MSLGSSSRVTRKHLANTQKKKKKASWGASTLLHANVHWPAFHVVVQSYSGIQCSSQVWNKLQRCTQIDRLKLSSTFLQPTQATKQHYCDCKLSKYVMRAYFNYHLFWFIHQEVRWVFILTTLLYVFQKSFLLFFWLANIILQNF